MPSMLINGSRLELQLENRLRFLSFNQQTPAIAAFNLNYTVTNPQIHLQLIDLSSRIFAVLLQESINNGLEWSFDQVHTVPASTVKQSFMLEATRALSRVKTVKAIPYAASTLKTTDDFAADVAPDFKAFRHVSFCTPPLSTFKFKNWRFILGSLSYPAHDVRTDVNDGARIAQSYIHAVNSYGWHQSKMAPGLMFDDFSSGALYQAVQSLERSSSLQQSGLSLSMDATLRFLGELGTNSGTVYTADSAGVYMFITYSTVVVVIGDKVIVKT
jgi:hypothetical protein